MPVIYKITSPSGKVYIGQSWDFDSRMRSYKSVNCKKQPGIYRSLLKYGFSKHRFVIICELPDNTTQDELDEKEIYYFWLYKNMGISMLNVRYPGKGGKFTKESIEKRASQIRGRKLSEEHRQKLINNMNSEEQKEKRRIKLTGHDVSLETRKKISDKIKEIWKSGKYDNRKERKDRRNREIKEGKRISNKRVIVTDTNDNIINIYNNCKECAEDLRVLPHTISDYICRHRLSKGRKFSYELNG